MPKFTDDLIKRLSIEPERRDRLVFDTVCPGLGLRITPKSKTFLVQWTDPATRRKQRDRLDVWGNLTVDQARTAARIRLGEVAKGVNPRIERIKARVESDRRQKEKALIFDRLIDDWAQLHLAKRRPRYAAEAARALRVAFPELLNKPAADIGLEDVLNPLDALVAAGKSTTAGRTLAYGRASFNWALKRGMVPANPFTGLPLPVANAERDRVLDDSEVAEVWRAAGTLVSPFGHFLRLALLTLARRDEVAGMRWSEVSTDRREWTIPGARTKNGKPHVVHLSNAALDVLTAIERIEGQDLVFSTTGRTPITGFSSVKRALDKAIINARKREADKVGVDPAPVQPFVLHDFRRTGVTKLAAMGFDSVVADKLLNHQPGKLRGVAGVYQRHEFLPERARALDAWAALCLGERGADNVIPMRSAQ